MAIFPEITEKKPIKEGNPPESKFD